MTHAVNYDGPPRGELVRSMATTKRAIEDTLLELENSPSSTNRRTELLWRIDVLLDAFFGANATRPGHVLDVLNEFERRFKLGKEELDAFEVVRIRADGLSRRIDDFRRNGSLMRHRPSRSAAG